MPDAAERLLDDGNSEHPGRRRGPQRGSGRQGESEKGAGNQGTPVEFASLAQRQAEPLCGGGRRHGDGKQEQGADTEHIHRRDDGGGEGDQDVEHDGGGGAPPAYMGGRLAEGGFQIRHSFGEGAAAARRRRVLRDRVTRVAR